MKKLFCIGGIGIIVLIIVAVIVTALSLDGIVKKGVETFGPQMTKVSINLDSVHIGLLSGSDQCWPGGSRRGSDFNFVGQNRGPFRSCRIAGNHF